MSKDSHLVEHILVEGLTNILKRTLEVNTGDQLAIAQEYREWINCLSVSDFSEEEILVIDKTTFK